MHLVMGPQAHTSRTLGYGNAGEGPRKGLFMHMWMAQYPLAQHLVIRPNNFPPIGIMLPAAVSMTHGDGKAVDAGAAFRHFHLDDISRPRQRGLAHD